MIDISNVTSQGPHIGSFRTTKYEASVIGIGPNGFELDCTERNVYGSRAARLKVPESLYTTEQIAIIHAALSLIEEGFRVVHDTREDELKLKGIDIPREEVHKLVAAAEQARADTLAAQAETLRITAANIAEQADLDAKRAEADELERNLATIRAAAPAAEEKAA